MYQFLHAFMPYYGSYGENQTLIIQANGEQLTDPRPLQAYKRALLFYAHLDPRALNYWTTNLIGGKLYTPLILNDSLIYIPIKIRHTIGKSDGAYGYFLATAISHYDDYTITLADHTTLPTLSSAQCITKKLRDAKLLRYAYLEHKKSTEFMTL